MAPDSIDADPTSLPRSFRGYNRRATEELFRRVAWDLAVLSGEHRKLKQSTEELHPPARQRADFDEDAHALLAAAQRAARELRESTRAECEEALRKAKSRAAAIEEEAERSATDARAVLEAAAKLRASLTEALSRLERGELPGPTAPAPDAEANGTAVEAVDLALSRPPGVLDASAGA